MSRVYTKGFYTENLATAAQSAAQVAPFLMELVRPASVLDVGCGTGAWLETFMKLGAGEVLGIDGEHVPPAMLRIPADRFITRDLATPLHLERTFDLVLSLEVAEHLPAGAATSFVESLASLGPVVAFSAAVPGQTGQGHVNEQWPEYWIDLFAARGFGVVDCIRPRFWDNADVAYWYAQNMLVFVDRSRLSRYPRLAAEQAAPSRGAPYARVHPRAWLNATDPRQADLRRVLAGLPFALRRAVSLRFRRLTGR